MRLRRVFLSLCDAYDELVEELRDRLGRLRGASRTLWEDMYWSPSASTCPANGLRFGGGEAGLDAAVEMVETEDVDMDLEPPFRLPLELSADLDRLRPRSEALAARTSSAVPFLRRRSLGTSLESLGASLGFLS